MKLERIILNISTILLGKYVRDDVIFNTIQLVSENAELQPYVAQESWVALKASSECFSEKQPLTQVIRLKNIAGLPGVYLMVYVMKTLLTK